MHPRALATALGLVVLATVIYVSIRATRDLSDFRVYLTAGQRAVASEPLYRAEDGFFQFKYLPAFAFAVSPLAALDPEAARVVWFGLSFALLLAFVRGSVRAWPERHVTEARLLLFTVLVMARDYVRELSLGQTNVLFGALVLAAVISTTRQRPALAGAWIAAAVFVKPYAVIFVPWLAWTAGLRALSACAAIVLAALAAPALIYGWNGNIELLAGWYRTVTDTTAPSLLLPENISFASMWVKWIGAGSTASVLALGSAAVTFGAVMAHGIRRDRPNTATDVYLDAAALLILVPLISPQGWDYVLVLATPAVVCLLDRWPTSRPAWKTCVSVALIVVALPSRDLLGLALHRRLMATAVLSVAAIVLWSAVLTVRRAGSDAGSP